MDNNSSNAYKKKKTLVKMDKLSIIFFVTLIFALVVLTCISIAAMNKEVTYKNVFNENIYSTISINADIDVTLSVFINSIESSQLGKLVQADNIDEDESSIYYNIILTDQDNYELDSDDLVIKYIKISDSILTIIYEVDTNIIFEETNLCKKSIKVEKIS